MGKKKYGKLNFAPLAMVVTLASSTQALALGTCQLALATATTTTLNATDDVITYFYPQKKGEGALMLLRGRLLESRNKYAREKFNLLNQKKEDEKKRDPEVSAKTLEAMELSSQDLMNLKSYKTCLDLAAQILQGEGALVKKIENKNNGDHLEIVPAANGWGLVNERATAYNQDPLFKTSPYPGGVRIHYSPDFLHSSGVFLFKKGVLDLDIFNLIDPYFAGSTLAHEHTHVIIDSVTLNAKEGPSSVANAYASGDLPYIPPSSQTLKGFYAQEITAYLNGDSQYRNGDPGAGFALSERGDSWWSRRNSKRYAKSFLQMTTEILDIFSRISEQDYVTALKKDFTKFDVPTNLNITVTSGNFVLMNPGGLDGQITVSTAKSVTPARTYQLKIPLIPDGTAISDAHFYALLKSQLMSLRTFAIEGLDLSEEHTLEARGQTVLQRRKR